MAWHPTNYHLVRLPWKLDRWRKFGVDDMIEDKLERNKQ